MSKQTNRGTEAKDDIFFGTPKAQQKLKDAVNDMSFLLTRGYSEKSSIHLVGHRYRLNQRQQKAVRGMSAPDCYLEHIARTEVKDTEIKNQTVYLDGFNVIILLESALSNAYLFRGKDNCFRDLSTVQGTYKKVSQTPLSIQLVGDYFKKHQAKNVVWFLDKPVSNSGRLKTMLYEIATEHNYNWEIILDNNPDNKLAESDGIIISSDAGILTRIKKWFNLVSNILDESIENKNTIELFK